jgi:uncharacterized protein (TIGR02466 family)
MISDKAEINGWFATPTTLLMLPDHETRNRELTRLFLEKEQQGEKFRHHIQIPTQRGALFESRFDLFDWPDAPVQRLSDDIHQVLSEFVASVNNYSAEQMLGFEFFYDSWFHITRTGGYQSIHTHANACWSGIYCVNPGAPSEVNPESGQVKFYDPRGSGPVMHFDPGNWNLDPRYSLNPVYLDHKAGQLVLFPSWLPHEVLPYQGKTDRIVVAFNAWMGEVEAE